MKIIIPLVLVLLCSNGLYAESDAKFYITFNDNDSASCRLIGDNEVIVAIGHPVRLDVESRETHMVSKINNATCKVTRDDGTTKEFPTESIGTPFYVRQNTTMDMVGHWSCRLEMKNERNVSVTTYCNVAVKLLGKLEYKTMQFRISRVNSTNVCSFPSIGKLYEGEWFKIQVTGTDKLQSNGTCTFKKKETTDPNHSQTETSISFYREDPQNSTALTSKLHQLKKHMNGSTLECIFAMRHNENFDKTTCKIRNLEIAAAAGNEDVKPDLIMILAIVGGVIVALIIIGQTIALLRCHFKSKAQSRIKLEHLKAGNSSFDRNDRARYSSAPSLRGAKPPNRAAADTDSHIYEFVGVNALYLGHESSLGSAEANIKNRPPLPLPGSRELETAEDTPPRPPKGKSPLMASTMSLNSTNSNTLMRKDPKPTPPITSRPPKPDEESLPGSLKRPPKPLPKTGSIPKPTATDPKFLELKNAIKKRNGGIVPSTASPSASLERSPPDLGSSANIRTLELKEAIEKRIGGRAPLSQSATLEKKAPPTAPKKTFPANQLRPGEIKLPSNPVVHGEDPKPLAAVNPTVKPLVSSSLKSKIEASLKLPQPGMMPVKTQPAPPVTSLPPPPPVTSPVTPSPMMKNRPLPVPNMATRPLPPLQSEEVPPAIKNRPLPNVATRPLPPIQQEAADSEDEEWTYEPLQSYNFYNV